MCILLRSLIPVLCLLLLTAPARADFDAGMAAYERGEFEIAMTEWLPLADAGDAEAQFRVGRLFDRGEGRKQHLPTAFRWYEKAAKNGQINAMFNVGHMLWHGEGVMSQEIMAITWFSKAANMGHAGAQDALAIAYAEGRGVEQNDNTAVYWFKRSARQGYMYAQGALGWHYRYGKGVEKSIVEAYKWHLLSVRAGNWRSYISIIGDWFSSSSAQRQAATHLADTWSPASERVTP